MVSPRMDTVTPLEKPVDKTALPMAITAYVAVSNLECVHCATWIRNGLLKLDGVLVVEIFFRNSLGIVAVTYDPLRVRPFALLAAVETAGKEICHAYGAEFIGQQPALQAAHLS